MNFSQEGQFSVHLAGLSRAQLSQFVQEGINEASEYVLREPEVLNTYGDRRTSPGLFWQEELRIRLETKKVREVTEPSEIPYLLVAGEGPDFEIAHNPEAVVTLDGMLAEVAQDALGGNFPMSNVFVDRIADHWEWMKQQQYAIGAYTCAQQHAYLRGIPASRVALTKNAVKQHLKLSGRTIQSFTKDLRLQLPDGRVVLINDILFGRSAIKLNAVDVLNELEHNPTLYDPEKDRWASVARRKQALEERLGVSLSNSNVGAYTTAWKKAKEESS